jgi:glycosyltransferase involved in cell wall biosynthesis
MRIAFQHMGSEEWIAGNSFLENLFAALCSLTTEKPYLALVINENTPERDYRTLLPYVDQVLTVPPNPLRKIQERLLRYRIVRWLRNRLLNDLRFGRSRSLSDLLKKHDIDCFFSIAWGPLCTHLSVPNITWIYDFQHIRLLDMFTLQERAVRDRIFHSQIQSATLVLPSSEDVRRDLEAFAPAYAVKARPVQFVAHIPSSVYGKDPRELLSIYHLPEKFFYLPNQFWKHKNHTGVLEALRILKKQAVRPYVVCTGNPLDPRHPSYFADLMQKLSSWNIRDQVIFLGIVPREHVFLLMRQAICVLNPSLFEGLGLSVAESKSLGKRVLLSDLPVLREQDPPCPVYFDPKDAKDLADKMEMIWKTTEPGPDLGLEAIARAALPGRQQEFGRDFLQIVREATALWKTN